MPSGHKPVEELVNALEERIQAKVVRMLELLKEFGVQIGSNHAKKVIGTPLWELRIVGADSIRIFYIAKEKKTFLLLHAIKKKTQKTEKREIVVAMDRLNNYLRKNRT